MQMFTRNNNLVKIAIVALVVVLPQKAICNLSGKHAAELTTGTYTFITNQQAKTQALKMQLNIQAHSFVLPNRKQPEKTLEQFVGMEGTDLTIPKEFHYRWNSETSCYEPYALSKKYYSMLQFEKLCPEVTQPEATPEGNRQPASTNNATDQPITNNWTHAKVCTANQCDSLLLIQSLSQSLSENK